MLEAEKQIRRARLNILQKYKYFASVALMPIIHHNEITEVMATDGKALYFNDKGLSSLPYEDIYAITLHEILHCVFMHQFRRKTRNQLYFQYAADYAVNSFIKNKIKLKLPEPHLYNPKYDNLSTEEIYDIITKPFENKHKNKSIDQDQDDQDDFDNDQFDPSQFDDSDQNDSDQNDSDQDNSDQDNSDQNDQDQDDSDQDNSDQDNSDQNQSNSGSNNQSPQDQQSNNSKQPNSIAEELAQSHKPFGQIIDTPDQSIKSEALCKQTISNALSSQSKDYIAKELLNKIIDTNNKVDRIHWFQILQNYIRDLNYGDYGYHIPNVRYVYSGFYLPSFKVKKLSKLSLVIDVSGSIVNRPKMLNDFFEHIRNVAEDCTIDNIDILTCNTSIVDYFNVSSNELMFHNFDIHGGGGTYLSPAFDFYNDTDNAPPDLMIFFTDLDGDYPQEPPPFPVIWVLINIEYDQNLFLQPRYGEAVYYIPTSNDIIPNRNYNPTQPMFVRNHKTNKIELLYD